MIPDILQIPLRAAIETGCITLQKYALQTFLLLQGINVTHAKHNE